MFGYTGYNTKKRTGSIVVDIPLFRVWLVVNPKRKSEFRFAGHKFYVHNTGKPTCLHLYFFIIKELS